MQGVWTALREIAPGEEVTVSYLAADVLGLEMGERRRQLRMKPGMEHVVCRCGRCAAEQEEEEEPGGTLAAEAEEQQQEQEPGGTLAAVVADGSSDTAPDAAVAEAMASAPAPAAAEPAPEPEPQLVTAGDHLWAGGELDEMD